MNFTKVCLLFGGQSHEHKVSIMSARSVFAQQEGLDNFEFHPTAITRNGFWLSEALSKKILNSDTKEIPEEYEKKYSSSWQSIKENFDEKIDLAFPLLHGPFGEDGTIQGFLETSDIPYVGCDVTTSVLGMDKIYQKNILENQGFPQANYISYNNLKNISANNDLSKRLDEEVSEKTGYPCFVKPSRQGSSLGISRVRSADELNQALEKALKYDDRVLIEESIAGREIECSVLAEDEECKASVPGEIIPAGDFYDYKSKYLTDETELITPAELSSEIEENIRSLSCDLFRNLGGKGFARIDFFLTSGENEVLINEINTIPGFTKRSMYPKMWQESGLDYVKLLQTLFYTTLKN
ncbi:D-alanine--D-alanine ligase family protein [Halarsenatibacter silvermanii]|uniref:D-alanine--D-alanine ligase n=1 Tax=Halarsenatibacter silvermanii TaxID=321763 RepID=A0A1G9JPL6_9FIRM|nr:D-alanine--D-alanine ligase family protein [Halarsenatibacter silvermanii]SDL39155.1 D-alanine-D-alanine ligase [Halarsenatibacter silvermanii]